MSFKEPVLDLTAFYFSSKQLPRLYKARSTVLLFTLCWMNRSEVVSSSRNFSSFSNCYTIYLCFESSTSESTHYMIICLVFCFPTGSTWSPASSTGFGQSFKTSWILLYYAPSYAGVLTVSYFSLARLFINVFWLSLVLCSWLVVPFSRSVWLLGICLVLTASISLRRAVIIFCRSSSNF
jgi:hypothetical protein